MGRAATIRRDWKIIDFRLKSFRRCLFAVASFMLALIGLKKFRSYQKPNRIARTFDAFDGRRDPKQGVSGPALGVAGSVAESWESGGRLQSRFGGPEAKHFLRQTARHHLSSVSFLLVYQYGALPLGAPRLSYRWESSLALDAHRIHISRPDAGPRKAPARA